MVTCERFKEIVKGITDNPPGYEPEIRLQFSDRTAEYMIIVYGEKCTFQRCGYKDGSGEVWYRSLDELYESETVDGILLKRDWGKITELVRSTNSKRKQRAI